MLTTWVDHRLYLPRDVRDSPVKVMSPVLAVDVLSSGMHPDVRLKLALRERAWGVSGVDRRMIVQEYMPESWLGLVPGMWQVHDSYDVPMREHSEHAWPQRGVVPRPCPFPTS
eukprot:jgi/Chlat1/1608/Chrsp126S00085